MKLVSFYAPRPTHAKHVYNFAEALELQLAFCRRYGVTQIVITDAEKLGPCGTFRVELPPRPEDLMRAILLGQLRYLESDPQDDVLLVGADGLLGRDPRFMFDDRDAFDLAVTTGKFSDCILNTGLIAVPQGRASLVAGFWRRALERCGDDWGDDQKSLAGEIRPTLQHGIEERDGVRVKFLPVKGFNDVPSDIGPAPVIVHFRGPRKRRMRQWASRVAAFSGK